MPRNSQGLYTLPPSNPVAPNTLIEAEWANATMEDIGEALTESLPRDGSAPMTGPLILKTGAPTQPREAVSKSYMDQFLAYATGMPVGAVFAFASGATPPGYLLCNGQSVSRTTYAMLFTAIGTVYGSGDGTSTFNVPDLRDEFVRGKADARPLGNKQAAAFAGHIHVVDDPGHIHGASAVQNAHAHVITTGSHTHGVNDPGHSHTYPGGAIAAAAAGVVGTDAASTFNSSATSTGISIQSAGNLNGNTDSQQPAIGVTVAAAATGVSTGVAGGDETRPQNIGLDYYIKAINDTTQTGAITSIGTSDANMITIDNTNPIVPILDIQSNVAFGIPKLDASGKIPLGQMPTSGSQFLGYFDASPGLLPVGTFNSGDYYAVSVQGTLTVYDPVNLTAAPTLVAVGSQLHYVSGSVSNPTGWYYIIVSGATLASDVQFIPTGTIAATNVQSAIAEVNNEKVALSGGTMTGPLTSTALTSDGQIESKATGFKFPDETVQASAALTAFIGGNQSFADNGYQKLPGGLIIQWGVAGPTNANGGIGVNFPIAFPVDCLSITANALASGSNSPSANIGGDLYPGGVTLWLSQPGSGFTIRWIAVGH